MPQLNPVHVSIPQGIFKYLEDAAYCNVVRAGHASIALVVREHFEELHVDCSTSLYGKVVPQDSLLGASVRHKFPKGMSHFLHLWNTKLCHNLREKFPHIKRSVGCQAGKSRMRNVELHPECSQPAIQAPLLSAWCFVKSGEDIFLTWYMAIRVHQLPPIL